MDTVEPRTWWADLLDVDRRAAGGDGLELAGLRDLVASWVVTDSDLPGVDPAAGPVSLTVSGGAGQIAGPAALAARRGVHLRSLRVTLRDPGDLRGNARRVVAAVDAARAEGALGKDTVVVVAMPDAEPGPDWQAAVDEVAALELEVALPTDGADPLRVAAWLQACLDRETAVTALGGDPLCLLGAVRRSFDGAGAVEVAAALSGAPGDALAGLDDPALVGARRWLPGVHVDGSGPASLAAGLRRLGVRP